MLNRAGRIRYHVTFNDVYTPSSSGLSINGGYMKIPRNVGTTNIVPKM